MDFVTGGPGKYAMQRKASRGSVAADNHANNSNNSNKEYLQY